MCFWDKFLEFLQQIFFKKFFFCGNFVEILVSEHKYIWLNLLFCWKKKFVVEITTLHECGHPRYMNFEDPKLKTPPEAKMAKMVLLCVGSSSSSWWKLYPCFKHLGTWSSTGHLGAILFKKSYGKARIWGSIEFHPQIFQMVSHPPWRIPLTLITCLLCARVSSPIVKCITLCT
jgi:hypothetical protein